MLSPAKSLDYESPLLTKRATKPRFIEDSAELISQLRKLSEGQEGDLMSISEKLAHLNPERFASWEADFTKENARAAILAFTNPLSPPCIPPNPGFRDLSSKSKFLAV